MSFVYIICTEGADKGPVKVGVTTDLKKRLACLNTASPHPLEVFAVFDAQSMDRAGRLEQDLHLVLQCWRLQGEWFNVTPQYAAGALSALVNPEDALGGLFRAGASLQRRQAKLKTLLKAAGLENETPKGHAKKIMGLLSGKIGGDKGNKSGPNAAYKRINFG
jgi:hypothetical protein